MTPEQHNKYLGRAHVAYGVLTSVAALALAGLFTVLLSVDPEAPPWPVAVLIGLFIGVIYALLIIPSFIAGHALLRRKRWAKTAAIAGGVVAAISFPIGTALCVYTFWFLFSQPGKFLYDSPQRMLLPERDVPLSLRRSAAKEEQYVPPPAPPDWR